LQVYAGEVGRIFDFVKAEAISSQGQKNLDRSQFELSGMAESMLTEPPAETPLTGFLSLGYAAIC
jgi:hypothetical protein